MPHHHHHTTIRNLKLAFFLNLGFTLIEIVGGILTNSTAILADAVHDLGDSVALAQAWYFESISDKKGTAKYTYGYRRFTLLGAFLSALLLLLSSFYVLSEAIPRIMEPEHSNAQGMAMLAILGIAVNGFAMLRLSTGKGANTRVITLHLLEDVLGWIAVLAVAIILLFKDIPVLDPILAVLITLYILANVVKQLKSIIPVFLQAAPLKVDVKDIEKQINQIVRVDSVHHLHLWSLDDEKVVLTVHIVTDRALNHEEYIALKRDFKAVVEAHSIYHSTLEVEWPEEVCRIENNGSCQ